MNGAREYAELFKTAQHGRLYLVSGSHARGKTFEIYVLPADAVAKPNGDNNPPLNAGSVCVYGMTGGQRGWTETYGWLHNGKWQVDFEQIVQARRAEIKSKKDELALRDSAAKELLRQKESALLSSY